MLLNGYGVSVWENEKVLEISSGDWLHDVVNVINTIPLYIEKWLK